MWLYPAAPPPPPPPPLTLASDDDSSSSEGCASIGSLISPSSPASPLVKPIMEPAVTPALAPPVAACGSDADLDTRLGLLRRRLLRCNLAKSLRQRMQDSELARQLAATVIVKSESDADGGERLSTIPKPSQVERRAVTGHATLDQLAYTSFTRRPVPKPSRAARLETKMKMKMETEAETDFAGIARKRRRRGGRNRHHTRHHSSTAAASSSVIPKWTQSSGKGKGQSKRKGQGKGQYKGKNRDRVKAPSKRGKPLPLPKPVPMQLTVSLPSTLLFARPTSRARPSSAMTIQFR